MARIPAALLLVLWGLAALDGCSEPGGGGYYPLDTGGLAPDTLFVPDVNDSSEPDLDTTPDEPETSAPELPIDTAPEPDTTPPDTTVTTDTTDTTADTAPADTAPDTSGTCTYHTDCYPERVCARWVTTGTLRCSDPCAGDSDCGPGGVCSKVPGSTQVGYCQDAPPGLVPGSPCASDEECRSRLCADGVCVELCLDEGHCATPGMTCHASGDLAVGLVTSVCSPDPGQSIALGQACTPDGFTYDSRYCASGHCDLLSLSANVCAPICKSEADCAPVQECNLVLFSAVERADAVPYDPAFTQKTHDAVSACYTPIGSGTAGEGSPCTSRAECRSNKCLPLLPGSAQTFCTSFCTSDAQCPASMACKLEALTLSSEWLVADGNQAPGSWTFVRVCKFR